MKFSTKEDLEIGIDEVFVMLSDFDGFERMFMRHGVDVMRLESDAAIGLGSQWRAKAKIRGKMREFKVELVDYDRPNCMGFTSESGGIASSFIVELVALSRNRTRMRVELDVKPKTLPARLLMQSARLARNNLNKRYKTRVAHFAEDLEDRHVRSLRT
jgi:hypothetical protein